MHKKTAENYKMLKLSLIFLVLFSLAITLDKYGLAPAYSQTGSYDSLAAALEAIGDKEADLIVQSNKTWNIASDTTIPANVNVDVRKGGIFDISAGATLTIKGELKGGNYGIFDGAGKVDFAQGEVNVIWFTNGGNGHGSSWNGANGQGGIGEAVSRTVKGHIYNLPPGDYDVRSTITVNKHGSVIQGEKGNYLSAAPNAPSIWIGSDGPIVVFDFDLGSNSEMLRDCALRNIAFFSASGDHEHTIIRATNTSNFEIAYIMDHYAKGTAVDYRGKENGVIRNNSFAYVRYPIKISKNPRSSDGVDIDNLVIRDGNTSCGPEYGPETAHITMADGLVFKNIIVEGLEGWQTCFHGVYWNDNSSTQRSGSLSISNTKFEQCFIYGTYCDDQAQYASYAFYIHANAGLDNFIAKNFKADGREAGLLYARNVTNVALRNGSYGCYGLGAGTGAKTCYVLDADNVNMATLDGVMTYSVPEGLVTARTPGMSLVHDATGRVDIEKDFRKIFIRQ